MAQSVDYLYRSGSLDRELWEAEMNRAAGILTAPGGTSAMGCWDQDTACPELRQASGGHSIKHCVCELGFTARVLSR